MVYHEHAKHEHFYDHEHVDADKHKGFWSSLWGRRSFDNDQIDAHQLAYAGHKL